MDETAEQLRYRIRIAVKVCNLFRDALEANGNRYHGGLVPNLTSITDVFVLPFDVLQEQVGQSLQLRD